jgi:hypothetical protein
VPTASPSKTTCARNSKRHCCLERLLKREQAFEHRDRCVERRAHGASLRLAVPTASTSCSLSSRSDKAIAPLADDGAERDDAAVDALLDLTLEEGRVSEPGSPGDVGRMRSTAVRALALRVDPKSRRNSSVCMFDH